MGIVERKAREFKRREQEILDQSFKLFQKKDPLLVSMEALAQQCEMGRGILYKHFQNNHSQHN